MPFAFTKEQDKQKKLVFVFLAVILINTMVVWYVFFRKEKNYQPPARTFFVQEMNIDFDFLATDKTLKNLNAFGGVPSFGGEAGRSNPFLPF
jgi:hypothetical protein